MITVAFVPIILTLELLENLMYLPIKKDYCYPLKVL